MSEKLHVVNEVESMLLGVLTSEQIGIVSDTLIKALAPYEVTKACTDVAIYDDANERLLKKYCACLYVDGLSEKTVRQYKLMCKRLSDAIGTPYTKMGAYDIRYFLAMGKERGVSNRSLENQRAYISAFFQWMVREDIIAKNPCDKIKPIKYTDAVRKPFSDVEIDSLRSSCRTLKDRAIIEILLSSGVRVSELSAMKTSDINFDKMEVFVRDGKGNKERMTYCTNVAKKHLLAYWESRKTGSDAVIANLYNEHMTPSGVRERLKVLEKLSGVENVHPHRFRRTFASGLAARGMSVQDIQTLMGHSNINTTMEYVYVSDGAVSASYRKYA